MSETVGRREIVLGRIVLDDTANNHIHFGIGRIGEKHGLDIGVLIPHVNHTVLLLVGTRQLVLLDPAADIIVEMTGGDQPVLRTAVHRLRIDVVLLLVVLHEPPALAPAPEVLDGLAVDFLAMLIGDRIEIDSVASFLASCELSTSYGREATSAAYFLGGRMPRNGLIFTIFPIF